MAKTTQKNSTADPGDEQVGHEAVTMGRKVYYTDHAGRTHSADVAHVDDDGTVMLWVLHCDDNPHPPYRASAVSYDANGAPGTWAWPSRA